MAREQKQYYDADGNVVVDFDQNEHYARTDRNAFAGCDYHEGLLYFNHYVFDTSMNELAPVPLGDPDYAQDHGHYYLMRADYYKDGLLNCNDWRWGLWGYLDGQGAWSLPAALLGANPDQLIFDTQTLGMLFENLVMHDPWAIMDPYSGVANRVRYYRDDKGLEVDAILECGTKWAAIEVKLSDVKVDQAAESLLRLRR